MNKRGTGRRGLPVWALATVASLLILGCGAPFTADILAGAEDTTAPVVLIITPSNESYYARTVSVVGTVTDATDVEGVSGTVVSLRYEIPAASISQAVTPDADGAFEFTFPTSNFTGGTISLQVVAVDGNGNVGIASIALLYGGSDIATFEAIPQNQSVLLQWDPVPTATGYTVQNLGTAETVDLAPDESSYDWAGLTNGERYFFQLESVDESNETNISSEVSAIPLSPYTLMPTAEPFDDRVRLTWRSAPGVDRYVLEKSTSRDGPYFKRLVTTGTAVEDALISRDTFYYYRVYPESQDAVKSAWSEVRLLPYSTTGTVGGDYYGPLLGAYRVLQYGDYVFVRDNDGSNYVVRVLDASDPANLTQISSVAAAADFTAMAIDPDELLLYLAVEEQGVQAIDISDLAAPVAVPYGSGVSHDQWLGQGADSSFSDIAVVRVAGTSYVLGVGYDGFYTGSVVYNGSVVEFIPEQNLPAQWDGSDSIVMDGTTAYVTMESGAQIGYDKINVSNPASSLPVTTGYRMTATYAPRAIDLNSDYVVIHDGEYSNASVRIIDKSNDLLVATQSFSGPVNSVIIRDGFLYVSRGVGGVSGFDLRTTPTSADHPVMQPDPAGSAVDATTVNGYLVVAASTSIETFELLPVIPASSAKVQIGSGLTNMYDFAAVGTDAFFLHGGGLRTASLTDMVGLAASGPAISGLPGGYQLIVQGDRTLMPSPADNLTYVVTSPDGNAPQAIADGPFDSSELFSIGDYSYGFQGGVIAVYDTSDSSNIVHLRSVATDVSIIEMESRGDYLYAEYGYSGPYGSGNSGLVTFDISDPINPVEIARFDATATFNGSGHDEIAWHDMDLSGDYLYIAWSDHGPTFSSLGNNNGIDDSSGIMVFDISANPAAPSFVAEFTGDDVFTDAESWTKRFESIRVQGHLAVLASGYSANATQYEGRVVLFDVGDPTDIRKIKDLLPSGGYAGVGTADWPWRIQMWYGTYVFVCGRNELTYYEL